MTTIEDIIARLVHVVRPIVETHTHWHFSNKQEDVLKELDSILADIQVLASAETVKNAPVEGTQNV